MNIAFDIDGIISHFDDAVIQRALIFDKQHSNKGIIDRNKNVSQGMFDWCDNEKKEFFEGYLENCYPYLRPFSDMKNLLYHLKKMGHTIILVSKRGLDNHSTKSTTVSWLKEHDIAYDQLYICVDNKAELLKKLNVDIFVDDSAQNCSNAEAAGIFSVQKCEDALKREKFGRYAKNFSELTEIIKQKIGFTPEISKFPVIFDTDFSNEIDDYFALAYLLSTQKLNLQAITIAPDFSFRNDEIYIEKNVQKSHDEAQKMVKIIAPKLKNLIFDGDTQFMGYGDQACSDAVKKIIEVCKNNEKTIIISIGAPTNIAHAITLCPEIAPKIKLYALMGMLQPMSISSEYNMSQDFLSTKLVLSKIADKTIFPANCFSNLLISPATLKPFAKDSEVLKLIYDIFKVTMKTKFGRENFKSIYDLIVPYYLTNPFVFTETQMGIKINNSHLLFCPKSKNKINLVSYCDPDLVLSECLGKIRSLSSHSPAAKTTGRPK